jgi:predicted RNA-binding protein with RPS1 domain
MKRDEVFQRHWAETVRLYSGLLEGEERIEFIKYIANENILLASECRATSFNIDDELDDYLIEKATKSAKQFNQSQESAKGIMALAELNRYDEITTIFLSIKENRDTYLHNQVVINYVSNGNELQITALLGVLSRTNKKLYHKAIDKTFELGIFFSNNSLNQAKDIIRTYINDQEILLVAKTIVTYQLKYNEFNPKILLDYLLKNKQIKYSMKLISLYSLILDKDIVNYLDLYIDEVQGKPIILQFLNFCRKYNPDINDDLLRVKLSTHLNPQIKYLSLGNEFNREISTDVIYKIYLKNINIGNKSSIDFAMHLVNKYQLQDRINLIDIISKLLHNPKPQRIELAYKIIVDNNLSTTYSYDLIYRYLINTVDIKSFMLARQILVNHFEGNIREEKLLALCCIIQKKFSNQKIIKDILFKDLTPISEINNIQTNFEYFGIISGKFKGNYSVDFSPFSIRINLPVQKIDPIKYFTFIKFKFLLVNEKIVDSEIEITDRDVLRATRNKIFFHNIFIGQMLDLKIHSINNSFLYLASDEFKGKKFVIHISEISNNYVKNIFDVFSAGQRVRAIILEFDRVNRNIYCSLKELLLVKKKSANDINSPSNNYNIDKLRLHFKNR